MLRAYTLLFWLWVVWPVVGLGQAGEYQQTRQQIDRLRQVVAATHIDSPALVDTYLHLSSQYIGLDQADSAHYFLEKSQQLARSLHYLSGLYFGFAYQTELFDQNALYPEALHYADSSLHYARLLGDRELIGNAYMLMGLIYTDWQKPTRAIACLQQSLPLLPTRNHPPHDLARRFHALNNLSQSHNVLKQYPAAVKAGLQALTEAFADGSRRGQLVAHWSVGNAYMGLSQLTQALQQYEQGIQIAHAEQDYDGLLLLLPRFYDVLLRQNQSLRAEQVLTDGQKLIARQQQRLSVISQIQYYTYLSDVYERERQWQKLAGTRKALLQLSQQADQQRSARQLQLLRSVYAQQTQLAMLSQQQQLARHQLVQMQQKVIALGGVAVLLLLLGGAGYILLRQRRTVALLQLRNQLAQETIQTKLQVLKAQIHPHFLFNTLNNLYSFSLRQSPQTPGLILKLSSLLHYVLYECDTPDVRLTQELTFIESYVELEKLRYGSRLSVTTKVSGNVADWTVAPLLLIPLVENAFKHGAAQHTEAAVVSIIVQASETSLSFEVKNSIAQPLTAQTSAGIGLTNLRKRFELVFPNTHTFGYGAEGDHFVSRFTIWRSNR
ncbi:sensor histidine kinase [Spirosoma litoris]